MQNPKSKVIVCDKQGKLIETKLRKDIDRKNDCLKTVNIFLIDQNNRIFITMPLQSVWGGKWCSSAAGMVQVGETSEEAAVRTAKRELGIDDVSFLWESYYEFLDIKRFISFFYSKVDSKNIKGNPEDVSESKWVGLDDILQLVEKDTISPTLLVGLDTIKKKLIG
ncbi:NUDIX domain-containing protein [Candidatus Woesearchaeota archaeon]|nr:NUDIX domain-containing protein [Candidatus Woesearchaeota archaeon]